MTLRESLTADERPRERLTRLGPRALTDAELLALLLGSGVKGRNAIGVAVDLLELTNGLRGLQRCSLKDLQTVRGLGSARACLLLACFELGQRTSLSQIRSGEPVMDPDQIMDHCRVALSSLPIEHCIGLWLDMQNRLIDCTELSRGTINQTTVYTREVITEALKQHASGVIIAHNHPSGLAQPSPEDVTLTKALAQALSLVDVRLIDHIIVAGPHTVSLAQLGYTW